MGEVTMSARAEDVAVGSRVEVRGVRAQPALNGQRGVVLDWDAVQERWKVRMDDGSGKLLKTCNVFPAPQGAGAVAEDAGAASFGEPEYGPAGLVAGMGVEVYGLRARQELNGQRGTLVDFEEADARWKVRMEDGSGKLLKPSNLRPLEDPAPTGRGEVSVGSRVRVVGVATQAHLNGELGVVLGWDEGQARWKVRMDDGAGKLLKGANLESAGDGDERPAAPSASAPRVAPGDRVELCGLQGRPELNGMRGEAVELDAGLGRWKVRMDDGSGNMLREDNLQVLRPWRPSGEDPAVLHERAEPRSTPDRRPAESPPHLPPPAGGVPILFSGMHVEVCHLQARPELNGLMGTLVEFDDEEGRWKVRMDDGSGKKLRPHSLQPCAAMEMTPSTSLPPPSALRPGEEESMFAGGDGGLQPYDRVEVCGLLARPELNGLTGSLVEFDEAVGRWKVKMDDGTGKMLKPANVRALAGARCGGGAEPVPSPSRVLAAELSAPYSPHAALAPGMRVEVFGLQARRELNGQRGDVVSFDDAEGAWLVRLDDGSGKLLKSQHLRPAAGAPAPPRGEEEAPSTAVGSGASALAPGDRVEICGLRARPELNGLQGALVAFDEDEGRWRVRMDDGSGKMLLPKSLRPALRPPAREQAEDGAQQIRPGRAAADRSPSEPDDGEARRAAHGASAAPGCQRPEAAGGPPPGVCAGARVEVFGLQARGELNGQRGEAVEWDEAEGRWKVRMDDGSGKMLRPANLRVVASGSPWPAPHPEPAAAAVPPQLVAGARVVVCGLQARPELNGQRGELVEWVEAEGRWKVRMDDGTGKMFRPANVAPSDEEPPCAAPPADADGPALRPGDRAEVCGLQSRVELNGQWGELVEWDSGEGRWKVWMDDGSGVMLRPANLRRPPSGAEARGLQEDDPPLFPGAMVEVHGLQARLDLNGLQGEIVEWDAAEDRWRVRMDDGSRKMFRPTNLRATVVARPPPANGQPWQQPPCSTQPRHTGELAPGGRCVVFGLQARPELNGQVGELVAWDDGEERWKVLMDDGSGKLLRAANLRPCQASSPEPIAAAANGSLAAPATRPLASGPSAGAEVRPAPGSRIEVVGMHSKPRLNGQRGIVMGWDDAQPRWRVRLDDGSGKLFKEEHLRVVSPEEEPCDFEDAEGGTTPRTADRQRDSCERQRTPTTTPAGPSGVVAPGGRVLIRGIQTQQWLNGQAGTVVEWDAAELRWRVLMDDGSGKLLRPANVEPLHPSAPHTAAAAC